MKINCLLLYHGPLILSNNYSKSILGKLTIQICLVIRIFFETIIYGKLFLMMKIAYSPYILVAKASLNARASRLERRGVLLRVLFDNGTVGHADCHPWEELGDFSLNRQLDLLKEGRMTSLTCQSLYFAKVDAKARAEGINLFDGLEIPPSHYLVVDPAVFDPIQANEFPSTKVKVGRDLESEIPRILEISDKLESGSLRLDFNCSLSQGAFEHCLKQLEPLMEKIDFFEDPFPYSPSTWSAIQKKYSIRLACDREATRAIGHPESAQVIVLKPAVRSIEKIPEEQEFVVTSYMDHPLGQLTAMYTAAQFYRECPERLSVCGLLTQHLYQTNEFSEQLLIPPKEGTGFGFDKLLEKMEWIEFN